MERAQKYVCLDNKGKPRRQRKVMRKDFRMEGRYQEIEERRYQETGEGQCRAMQVDVQMGGTIPSDQSN